MGIALAVYAFGERGHLRQNPGPRIRVPLGMEIRASLRNTLPVPLTVHGLGDRNGNDAAVQLQPGTVEQVRLKPAASGLYLYWASAGTDGLNLRNGIDAELTGALVVDPPGPTPKDEIFVLVMISERPGLIARQALATIHGKSWPYTQRFRYEVGARVHWRWINATNEPDAFHLHGFYYRIDAFNRGGRIQNYEGKVRPTGVTQRIAQGETMSSTERPGNWFFTVTCSST